MSTLPQEIKKDVRTIKRLIKQAKKLAKLIRSHREHLKRIEKVQKQHREYTKAKRQASSKQAGFKTSKNSSNFKPPKQGGSVYNPETQTFKFYNKEYYLNKSNVLVLVKTKRQKNKIRLANKQAYYNRKVKMTNQELNKENAILRSLHGEQAKLSSFDKLSVKKLMPKGTTRKGERLVSAKLEELNKFRQTRGIGQGEAVRGQKIAELILEKGKQIYDSSQSENNPIEDLEDAVAKAREYMGKNIEGGVLSKAEMSAIGEALEVLLL